MTEAKKQFLESIRDADPSGDDWWVPALTALPNLRMCGYLERSWHLYIDANDSKGQEAKEHLLGLAEDILT